MLILLMFELLDAVGFFSFIVNIGSEIANVLFVDIVQIASQKR